MVRRFRTVEEKKDVYSKIRHWCSRAERSPAQVRRKLLQWGEADLADRVIGALLEEGFLDEPRFAEAYALDHVRIKGWGPRKVAAALRMEHGISDALITRALAAVQPEDIDEAARRAVRKRRLTRADEQAERTVGALLQRGFEVECARKAVAAEVGQTKFGPAW